MEEIRVIASSETYPLRYEVLWPHLKGEEQCGIDVDELEGTFHVGALWEGEVVTIATFLVERNEQFGHANQYRLRAMASSPKHRNKNFGRKVIAFAIDKLERDGIDLLWCDAREVALGFYEKLGFKVKGDFYNVPEIGPHKLMYYELN